MFSFLIHFNWGGRMYIPRGRSVGGRGVRTTYVCVCLHNLRVFDPNSQPRTVTSVVQIHRSVQGLRPVGVGRGQTTYHLLPRKKSSFAHSLLGCLKIPGGITMTTLCSQNAIYCSSIRRIYCDLHNIHRMQSQFIVINMNISGSWAIRRDYCCFFVHIQIYYQTFLYI